MFRVAVFAFAILSNQACLAQTPEEVARQYLLLVQQEKWGEAIALMHSDALEEFRQATSFMGELPPWRTEGMLKLMFGSDANSESVAAMTNAEYFTAFLRSGMGNAKEQGLEFQEMKVLGAVAESEEVQHVLVRLRFKFRNSEVERLEVATCLRTENGWKLGVDYNWKLRGPGLQMLRKRLGL